MVTKAAAQSSDREYLTATYFSLFLGFLGVDRFYMGYVGLGILKLITFGGFGIWWLIDLIWIALGNAKTQKGVHLVRTEAATLPVYIGVGIFLFLQTVGAITYSISATETFDSFDKAITELSNTLEGAEINTTSTGDNGAGTMRITFPEKQ